MSNKNSESFKVVDGCMIQSEDGGMMGIFSACSLLCEYKENLQAAEEREMILDSLIREIVTSVKSNHSFHGGGWGIDCGDEDCLGCYWQRQALEKVRENGN